MAEKIEFSKKGTGEVCTVMNTGPMVIEVCRESMGFFTVYGNLEGMSKVPIYKARYEKDLIFKVDVPECVSISLASETHVIEAQIEVIG